MSDPIVHPPVPRRPRRSALYVPGANARAIDKAGSLAADTLIFDLEDAVAPDMKAEARDAVTAAVFARDVGRQELVIRINGLDTEWGADDLTAALEAGPDALLLPKVESADDLDTVRRVAGEAREVALWAMIETPRGILAIDEIADELAAGTGTPGLVVGINDLALAMQARLDAGRSAFRLALQVTVLAARARGLIALDGVCNAIGDE
ncbi:MAG: aldolase/citrate lyase family protein, partial [Pseudomonadota bacterium]